MTKEACASLSSTITCKEFDPSLRLVERVGNLLISTLTMLKHQGAAFAAHRALQEIVEFCFATSLDESFANLPLLWAKRLMKDISGADNVRDSTLRRSTGYALAFLSIMRSEPPSGVAPRTISPGILATLVRLSLPPEKDLEKYMNQLGLTQTPVESFYSACAVRSPQFSTALEAEFGDEVRHTTRYSLVEFTCVSADSRAVRFPCWIVAHPRTCTQHLEASNSRFAIGI